MSKTNFSYNKIKGFDGIEVFSSSNEVDYFPFHSHDNFCVSLITKGVEILETKSSKIITYTNTINTTAPNEVHKNYSLNDLGYNYITLYISPKLLSRFNHGVKVHQLQRVIIDKSLNELILNIALYKDNTDHQIEKALVEISKYAIPKEEDEFLKKLSISKLNRLIDGKIDKTLNIDDLAQCFAMSKYHFIRVFKRQTGLTPQKYMVIYKLNKAQKLLKIKTPIKDVVYDLGFYDMSHFCKLFKKYFGVNPKDYYLAILYN